MIDHATALSRTKLQLPPRPRALVARPRLLLKLNHALDSKVTLLTAPAGFGKTTLLTAWLATVTAPVAWLALDAQDNLLPRFLRYLLHACGTLGQLDSKPVGATARALLDAPQQPAVATVFTQLTNDLATLSTPALLVLDDYHLLADPTIHQAMDFLIAHLPPAVHLVLAGRSQPSLRLARLRGQGQLLEITTADLRFTATEVAAFLQEIMHLDLTPAERATLEMRTEGWIAGIQLAGLSLQSTVDKGAFLRAFSGADRMIGDYLFEEVLAHQPPALRQFLLHTAVVESLCSDLCDVLLESQGSQAMLEELDAHQIFIVPLDHQRRWYRYHHLFGDLLRHHLQHSEPAIIPLLHRRAAQWYADQQQVDEAIRHSLLAQDYVTAASLLERAFAQRDWVQHEMGRLLTWYEALPAAISAQRPSLLLSIAWLLLEVDANPWPRITPLLVQVEAVLATPAATDLVSTAERATMLATIDLLRANRARHEGDPGQVIVYCTQALAHLPADETYLRSGILAHRATAHQALGELATAIALYEESIRLCQAAENVDGLLFAAAHLLACYTDSGNLGDAERLFAQTQHYAPTRSGPDMGLIYLRYGALCAAQQRLAAAERYLRLGLERCRPFPAWQTAVVEGTLLLADLLQANGDLAAAQQLLQDLERDGPVPMVAMAQAKVQRFVAAPDHSALNSPPYALPGSALTARELTALRLLATDRSMAEIADSMSVAVSSVRTYAKRIYSKLDVHSRAEAVYQAKALKLI